MIRADQPRLAGFTTIICAAVVALALVPASFAQAVSGGSISGQVTDSSGAVVAGADVTATQTDTQSSRTVNTDAQGHYTFPNLPVGPYLLQIKAQGFKTFDHSGIVLEVGNNIQVNATMQLGTLSESVEVSAAASMVETKENFVAQVINQKQINDLPLNGRQATQLILISGAATQAPADSLFSTKIIPLPSPCRLPAGRQMRPIICWMAAAIFRHLLT